MTHPYSQRQVLYVNPCHTCGFVGMERAEALDLIVKLGEHCTQDQRRASSAWSRKSMR
jgi:hypothetical protein